MKPNCILTIMTPLVLIAWLGAHAQVNHAESFDGTTFPPTGWTSSILSGTENWERVTVGDHPTNPPHSGAAMAQYNSWYSNSAGDQAVLVTPVINYAGRGSNTPTISFWMYRHLYTTSGSNGKLEVFVNTAPNTTGATQLCSINPRYDLSPAVASIGWYQYTYSIPASYTTATNYIIFKATSDWYNNIQMDDVAWVDYPTGPLPPTGFTAVMATQSSIDLGWTRNASSNDVMIVYSTTGIFGTPIDGTSYSVGSSITGGGTVLYVGSGTATTHIGVLTGNTYYYRAYSRTSTNTYSSAYAAVSVTIPPSPPYAEGFEGITANNQFPAGWVYSSDARSFTAPYGSYNANPHSGNKFAAFYWSPGGVGYMINGGLFLTGGVTYNAFLWYVTDTYSGWNSLSLKWGTVANISTMTTVTGASVTTPTNGTYARLAGTFTPFASGLYYIGIACDHSTAPWYLSVDDLSVNDFPQKDIAVTRAVLRYSDSTWTRGAPRRHTVQAVIKNLGWENNPASLQMTYSDGNVTVAETVSPSWVGNTATVTFATRYTATTPGSVTITVSSLYNDAPQTANNSSSFTVPVQSISVVGYEDFDNFAAPGFNYDVNTTAEAFTVGNANGGGAFLTSVGTGVGGSQALEYPGDTQQANDWLITPPAYLNAGSSYRFRMMYSSQSGLPQNFQLYYGRTADPASMSPMVNGTFSGIDNTVFMETGNAGAGTYPYFNTTSAGYYYAAIKVASAANAGKLVFDNMMLDVNPAPPPKIGYRPDSPDNGAYIDDPLMARIDLTAIYHTPGIIKRRYQITNTVGLYGSNGYLLWSASTNTPWIKLAMDTPLPVQGPNPYAPPRPREDQYFSMTVDPTAMSPGTYSGSITLVATLFNDDYPATGPGLAPTNTPFVVQVNLVVTTSGTAPGQANVATLYNVAPGVYPMYDINNKLIAVVNNTGAVTIPSITITEYPNTLPPSFSRLRYVRKYWTIYASGDSWTMDVDLFYTDTELASGGGIIRGNLRGRRQAIPGGSAWTYAGGGATVNSSVSYPTSNMVRILNLDPTCVFGNYALATSWNYMPKSGTNPITCFALDQNYPNPFISGTRIDFAVKNEGPVSLVVYNRTGAEVVRVVDDVLEAGSYTIPFDAGNLPAGNYMYRLTSGTNVETRWMTLIR